MINPLFSVIVPVYGVEKYLNECVDSVLRQNFDNYEVILVNDGSKDNSPAICDEYAEKYSQVKVIHKENGGLVSARKAACRVISGKYVLNVDGDDWVRDDFLASLADVILGTEPDVICFGVANVFRDRIEEEQAQYDVGYYNRKDIEKKIFPELFMSYEGRYFKPSICAKAIKRELYKEFQLKVDNRIKIGEDVACTKPIIYNANSMYIMNECFYFYRQNEQSMTKNKTAFSMLTPELIYQNFSTLTANDLSMKEQVERCIFQMFFGTAISQFNRNESHRIISNDIIKELEKLYLKKVIAGCRYDKSNIKGNLAVFLLKHRLFILMRLAKKVMNK